MGKIPGLAAKAAAEFVGTFTVVFMGCGSVMIAERFPNSAPHETAPVVFGLAVASMIYALGHISGAHFNPAVSLAFALTRRLPLKQVAGYWAAQFIGAIAATGLLVLLLPHGDGFGQTTPHVDSLRAFGWEVVLTFFLMFVIMAVATDTRAVGTMAGAAIGATVAMNAHVGGAVTGASMNPARTLGPAMFAGNFDNLWIYLAGPAVGATLAAFLYEAIRCHMPSPGKGGPEGCC